MKSISITFCALVCVPSVLLSAADLPADRSPTRSGVLKLSAVTQAVLTANASVREARERASALAQRPAQASAWDDPKLALSSRVARFVNIAPNGFTDQMVGIEQSIPVSGRNQIRARMLTTEVVVATEEVRRRELDAVAKARSAYFRLARDHTLLELNRANELSWRETIETTRARFEVGTRSQADVLAAESELSRIAEARRDLERVLSDDQTELNVLMNRVPSSPLGSPVDTPRETNAHSLGGTRLQPLVLSRRPEVRIAEARLTVATTQRELARRAWVPDPTVGLTAQRYNSASQVVSEVGAGVSITLPWANPAKYRALAKEAADAQEGAQRALEQARLEALGRLRDQLARVETNQHHVELFRDRLVPLARQTLDATRTDYAAGRSVFADLLLAQRNVRDTESTYRHHIADLQMALAELEAVVGADLQLFPAAQPPTRR
jgi:cobalt-zinc-cadmium efflux system outer membrane protein